MSRFAAVAAELVTRWTALPELEGLTVRRGSPLGDIGADRLLMVEHDGSPDSRGDSTFETTWTDLAGTSIEERGRITCAVVVQTGDANDDGSAVTEAEATAAAAIARCVSDLAADRTLGGLVHSCSVTAGSSVTGQNRAGTAVALPFTVAYFATYAAVSA